MNKSPKFLLCLHPQTAAHNQRLFVLHTGTPVIFAQIHHYSNLTPTEVMEKERALNSEVYSRLDYPPATIFFTSIWMVSNEVFDALPAQQQADKMAGIMRRMSDWYESVLIHQQNEHQKKRSRTGQNE